MDVTSKSTPVLVPLSGASSEFVERFARIKERSLASIDAEVMNTARSVLDSIRTAGDRSLIEAVAKYDGVTVDSVAELRVRIGAAIGDEVEAGSEGRAATCGVTPKFRQAAQASIEAVRRWHQPQRAWVEAGAVTHETAGVTLTERVEPLRRVGLYVPGGRFVYPSSVIMTVVPAQVAGVKEIVVATPPAALAASAELRYVLGALGVTEVWGMGGAHAIGALAYGTETIASVSSIAGPGNAWVTAAKQLVRGHVGVDQDAGPSEVVIIASEDAPAEWVAADLIAQAEHDPNAVAVLLTPSAELAAAVARELDQQLGDLPTAAIARSALANFGALLVTKDLEHAWSLGETLAAEHQQLMGRDAEALAPRCLSGGALFVGSSTPTCFGDYAAGPSHVLPTGGSARFSSGLSVLNFVRRSHVVHATPNAAIGLARTAATMAEVEGLEGHRRSAVLRDGCLSSRERMTTTHGASAFVRPELKELPVYHLDQTPFTFKLDQNEVPWDMPTRFKREALRRLEQRTWAHYPDFHGDRLRAMIGARYGLSPESVLVGNGSNELLGIALEALVSPGAEVITLLPGFGLYEMFVRRTGGHTRMLEPSADLSLQMDALVAEVKRDPTRTVLLCTPNNPTGAAASLDQIRSLLEVLEAPLLLDNAYGEFCDQDYLPLLAVHPNLVVFRTFSKAWSLAGVRLGYLLAESAFVDQLIKVKLPYNVNHAAAVIGEVALENAAWSERCVRLLKGRRHQWCKMLTEVGAEVFPSQANFLLVRHRQADRLREGLAQRGILVRKVSHYPGLANCIRIAIGSGAALRATRAALTEILEINPIKGELR